MLLWLAEGTQGHHVCLCSPVQLDQDHFGTVIFGKTDLQVFGDKEADSDMWRDWPLGVWGQRQTVIFGHTDLEVFGDTQTHHIWREVFSNRETVIFGEADLDVFGDRETDSDVLTDSP